MALDYLSYDYAEDDYIDMEVSSFSTFLRNSISSPSNTREFEFQMSSTSLEREPTTSPADELFYKGKLLPLHLPPRLQMVEKLLQNTNTISPCHDHIRRLDSFEEFYSTPLARTTATTPTTASTPFESCNISPFESCRVSRELNPDEYMCEFYSTELSPFVHNDNPKKSWTKMLKQSANIGSKLKASRAYIKSWFGKSGCSSNEYSNAGTPAVASSTKVADEGSVVALKPKDLCSSKIVKAPIKKNNHPFGQIQKDKFQSFNKEKMSTEDIGGDGTGRHRRSFSVSIKRHSSTTKNKSSSSSSSSSSLTSSSSSSFCSNNSNGVQELQFLKRCSSANSDFESPIQGAIAHCKESQQLFRSRKSSMSDQIGFCSLSSSSSRLGVLEDQERPELCRG